MLDFIDKGFFASLPWHLANDSPGLRVSPLGITPNVNDNHGSQWTVPSVALTQRQFNWHPMKPCSLVAHWNGPCKRLGTPTHTTDPSVCQKWILADGFYQFGLALSGISELGIAFPTHRDKEQLTAFPLVLPMGWVKSPPAICAGTETVADLANARSDRLLPKHPLEDAALTQPLALPSLPSPTINIAAEEEPLAPPPLGHCSRPTPKRSWL